MPELGSLGSVRGALRNRRPYRESCNPQTSAILRVDLLRHLASLWRVRTNDRAAASAEKAITVVEIAGDLAPRHIPAVSHLTQP